MNGARSLLTTLVHEGVDVCFANPGTSEMHFVAALDDVPQMRGVLCLFEGVATGAADGYGRVTDSPAAVLLHLGPGLGNGLANLHNARRARTPIVNIVGDHATTHARYDAPLASDIRSVAATVSTSVIESRSPHDVAGDAVDAVRAAHGPPSGVSTLILPADSSWGEATEPTRPRAPLPARCEASHDVIAEVAAKLRASSHPAILVGGRAARHGAFERAAAIASHCDAELLIETFPSVSTRGAGTPVATRLSYLGEFASSQLADIDLLVLADAASPVSFFAYPGIPSDIVSTSTEVLTLFGPEADAAASLESLAAEIGAPPTAGARYDAGRPGRPTGPLTSQSLAAAVGHLLPEGAVVVDESNTSGIHLPAATAGAPQHDWLTLTGGAIGYGLPVAVGAAIGRPDAKILCLESDGSAMYTSQALWTMARESLNVTTVVLSNRSYAILNLELARVGAVAEGSKAASMLDLTGPELDFVALATSMGVPATRATSADELVTALDQAMLSEGPQLIEAVLPPGLS